MKTAQALFDDLVREIRLPVGQAIALTEDEPRGNHGQNWIAAVGNLPNDVKARYEKVVEDLKKQHPSIDWSAVKERNGERRHIAGTKTV
jgi:hypothetical protein